jgi:hypothetical protein
MLYHAECNDNEGDELEKGANASDGKVDFYRPKRGATPNVMSTREAFLGLISFAGRKLGWKHVAAAVFSLDVSTALNRFADGTQALPNRSS